MGMLAQISDAVNAAFAEYKKEFGENTQITDGTEFVTVFNNCALIVRAEGDTLKTEFIGGIHCGGVNFDWFTSKCFRAGKEYSWLCGAFLFLFDPCG